MPHEIEITEPPMVQLKKKRAGLKGALVVVAAMMILLIGASFIIVNNVLGPKPQALVNIPSTVTAIGVPIYDEKDIDTITQIPREDARVFVRLATKVVSLLAPTVIEKSRIQDQPYSDDLLITWKDLPAQGKFIQGYYETELHKRGFTVETTSTANEQERQVSFSKDKTSGNVTIVDDPVGGPTEHATLLIRLP
ncbi:MAG: hypothetical protein HY984_00265 [Candidatus Magasanikbacteria bacterium]|nr:hypothetical protein [Candidatus Magasanikbacteria bacterium]